VVVFEAPNENVFVVCAPPVVVDGLLAFPAPNPNPPEGLLLLLKKYLVRIINVNKLGSGAKCQNQSRIIILKHVSPIDKVCHLGKNGLYLEKLKASSSKITITKR
jgi:hypothetical protein